MPLWAGRFKKELDKQTNDFNSSIPFDMKLYKEDILGSIAHATMLGECSVIDKKDADLIAGTLQDILEEIDSGELKIDMSSEDIHTFVEDELTRRIGDTGKRLHTSRSRNDQVALDLRLYLINKTTRIYKKLKELNLILCDSAREHIDTVMPGYTHLQRAQPITFGHHLMAYVQMFLRDMSRLHDAKRRMKENPLGAGALACTTHKINRNITTKLLMLRKPTQNSLDAVSDRDFCLELLSDLSIIMVHLSRFCEEVILWCSWEFKFMELDDAFATGSSIMPQKKNPDIAELVRGKSGRVIGDLMGLLTVMKGLPLAYNKDMQEDKEAVFDALENTEICISTFGAMINTAKVNKENMRKAAAKGFINATDCADYLVKKGVPFRDAYKYTGILVSKCIEGDTTLEDLDISEYKAVCSDFDKGVYEAISLENCVNGRSAMGGPSRDSVLKQIDYSLSAMRSKGID